MKRKFKKPDEHRVWRPPTKRQKAQAVKRLAAQQLPAQTPVAKAQAWLTAAETHSNPVYKILALTEVCRFVLNEIVKRKR